MAKIVLISNGESSYRTLEQGLNLYGYEVTTANRGDDGLLLALTESPDLILVDIDTPELDGWQVVKNLKQSRTTWLIPTIAIADRDVDGQLLIQAGFDAYDRKPLSLKHLLLRIETLLEKASPGQKNVVGDVAVKTPASPPEPILQKTYNVATTDSEKQLTSDSVVYIDDSPADSRAMAQIVENAGYSYVNISDSLQALPLLLEIKPQLIFLDLVMPMANGYELCAQIRRISVFKKTPIVIVTNNNGIADRLRSRFVGAYGFLHKPIKEGSVLKILKKYARQPVSC